MAVLVMMNSSPLCLCIMLCTCSLQFVLVHAVRTSLMLWIHEIKAQACTAKQTAGGGFLGSYCDGAGSL